MCRTVQGSPFGDWRVGDSLAKRLARKIACVFYLFAKHLLRRLDEWWRHIHPPSPHMGLPMVHLTPQNPLSGGVLYMRGDIGLYRGGLENDYDFKRFKNVFIGFRPSFYGEKVPGVQFGLGEVFRSPIPPPSLRLGMAPLRTPPPQSPSSLIGLPLGTNWEYPPWVGQ